MLDDTHVKEILAVVLRETGVDFLRYRRATVLRRIHNRMLSLRVSSQAEYLARLQSDPLEPAGLAERITIKVSRFYRNAATFDLLWRDVLPGLARQQGGRPLQVWSAGCGCGEEAYSLAMLLEEGGLDGTVDATDVDPSALAAANAGTYTAAAMAELPPEWAERYTDMRSTAAGPTYTVRPVLRDRVRFFRHDLTSDTTPQRRTSYDFVACRNVLIYLQPHAQQQALGLLADRLRPGGVLCLGEAEWPPAALAGLLLPTHQRHRIFARRILEKEPTT